MLFAGMKDVGIYRVSGLSSEVQRFQKAFEKSTTFFVIAVY